MPAGIIIILIMTVLVLFGFGESILEEMCLTNLGAIILFLALTLSYIINPLYLEGVTAYYLPYIILLFYSIKLLFRLKYPLLSLFLAVISSLVLCLIAQVISPQPIGLIYEPFFIYALIIGIINIIFSYGIRSLIFNSIFSFILFNSIMIFIKGYNNILPHDAFSAVCFSCLIACYPVSVLSKNKLFFKYQRIFQRDNGEQLILKKRK